MTTDFRATITQQKSVNQAPSNTSGAPGGAFGTGEIMEPLRIGMNNRVIFPYTPTITMSGTADYDEYSFTHSNYNYHAYNKSSVADIIVTGDFTAQTDIEAKYMLAVMHFMRSNTKSEFGSKTEGNRAGTPPPVLRFNYLGDYQFKNVPVIIKNYTYTLPPDVDYVPVTVDNKETRVPTSLNMTITLAPYYNPKMLRDDFTLDGFKSGSLLDKGFI